MFCISVFLLAAQISCIREAFQPEQTPPPLVNGNLETQSSPVSWCTLVQNPRQYDRQTLSVIAKVQAGNHGEHFWDESCPGDPSIYDYYAATAGLVMTPEIATEIKKARDDRKNLKWSDPLILTAFGRFEIHKPKLHDSGMLENSEFHFVILEVIRIDNGE